MFNLSLLLFFMLLLFSTITTTAQPYKAYERFLLDCGSSTASTSNSNQRWYGDLFSKFVPANITTTSFSFKSSIQDSSVPAIPYSTARIFNASSFTYIFPVSQGPKFLRLYFYPATYSDLNTDRSFFSVSSNGYTLLTNFSAFLTASLLAETRSNAGISGTQLPNFVKEFMIYVKDTQFLNVTFTPSPNSFAFINGIEIVSMPQNLYFNAEDPKYVGQTTGPEIIPEMALENIYRLNVGGGYISSNSDTGMYRFWEPDNNYLFPRSAIGLVPANKTPITYTKATPNYTAPELLYESQRSMGKLSEMYNLTWRLPVDNGFYYMLRLHFCNIIPQYTKAGQVVFTIFINNQTAEKEVDLLFLTEGSGYPLFKDYVVFVDDPDGMRSRSKQDLWVAMHPNPNSDEYLDAYLNGLEAFKLSMNGNLAGRNPELSSTTAPASPASPVKKKKKTPPYVMIIGGVVAGLVLLSLLVLIVFRQRRRVKHYGAADDKSSYGPAYSESKSTKSSHSTQPSDPCRRFSLTEVKVATVEAKYRRVSLEDRDVPLLLIPSLNLSQSSNNPLEGHPRP